MTDGPVTFPFPEPGLTVFGLVLRLFLLSQPSGAAYVHASFFRQSRWLYTTRSFKRRAFFLLLLATVSWRSWLAAGSLEGFFSLS